MRTITILLLAAGLLGCGQRVAAPEEGPAQAEAPDEKAAPAGAPERLVAGKSASQWIQSLNAPDGNTRARAAQVLTDLGPDAIPALQAALKDREPNIRCAAAVVLREIDQNAERPIAGLNVALAAAVQAMMQDLKHSSEPVRLQACDTLGYLGEDAGPAIQELARCLQHPDESMRGKAAWALGHIGESAQDAIPALIVTVQKDPSARVRRDAAEALGSIRAEPETVVAALAGALKDGDEMVRRQAVDALGAMGQPAVGTLIEVLKGSDLVLRKRALEAFFDLGGEAEAAAPALRDALKDPDPDIRRMAGEALRKIDPKAASDAGVP